MTAKRSKWFFVIGALFMVAAIGFTVAGLLSEKVGTYLPLAAGNYCLGVVWLIIARSKSQSGASPPASTTPAPKHVP